MSLFIDYLSNFISLICIEKSISCKCWFQINIPKCWLWFFIDTTGLFNAIYANLIKNFECLKVLFKIVKKLFHAFNYYIQYVNSWQNSREILWLTPLNRVNFREMAFRDDFWKLIFDENIWKLFHTFKVSFYVMKNPPFFISLHKKGC